MKSIVEHLRVAVISLEVAFLILVALGAFYCPNVFTFVGKTMIGQSEALKWFPTIPIALCAAAVGLAWKLTVPKEENDYELLEWPGYWRLKLRRDYSILISVLVAICAVLIWLFSASISEFWLGVLTIGSVGVGLINLGCMLLAALTLREIVGFKRR